MKLTRHELYIDPIKLSGYLLDINHTDGGSKAGLLMSFGFSIEDIYKLNEAILQHADNAEAGLLQNPFGDKFIVERNMHTPTGKSLMIRSIWIRKKQEEIIRFVTLYPL